MANLASDAPRVGDRLADRYELQSEIGRGGMGRVFRAHDEVLGRDVAIKVLSHTGVGDADFQRITAQEARAAARVAHPGVVTIFDTGVHNDRSFLVMELAPGESLRQMLHERHRLPAAEAAQIASQVADALEHAHRQGVFHCDVKPHNIIIPPAGGLPKLVDFGIARAASVTGAITTEEITGSVPYLAPEQVRGERIDGRTDVYALGVVLFEMLTGRTPFKGDNVAAVLAQRLTSDPPAPRSLNPAIPRELERVLLRALERDPSRRYHTAAAFRDALRSLSLEAPAPGQTRTLEMSRPPVRLPRPPRRPNVTGWVRSQPPTRLAVGGLLLGTVAVVLGLTLLVAALVNRGTGPQEPALPGDGWATFSKSACEWSNVATPPGQCFGERPPGFRVRVVDRQARRWLIWDPETQNVAYVDPDALRPD